MCTICCEPLNKSTRKPVTCGCEHVACAACTRRYLLESPNEPDCMSCHRRWTVPMLCEKLPKNFVNGPLREHTMEMVVDREKSRLPATQPYVTVFKNAMRQYAHRTSYRRLNALLSDREALSVPGGILPTLAINDKQTLLMEIGRAAAMTDDDLRAQLGRGGAAQMEPVRETYHYVRACPADGCRGFLNDKWCCELCETRVCEKCHEIKTASEGAGAEGAAPHACNPATVASVALLAKDSRPCPKCAAMIYRIDGCAHMFCTACNTPFHWTTGEIMTDNSNPLYYEWQRRRAAEARTGGASAAAPADAPECNTPEATFAWLRANVRDYIAKVRQDIYSGMRSPIAYLPMYISHNRYEIGTLQRIAMRWKGTNMRLEDPHCAVRMCYMLGVYDEDTFKKELQRRERKLIAVRESVEVYEMFNAAMGDLAMRAYRGRTQRDIEDLLEELNELRAYANDALGQLSRAHGLKMKTINESYRIPV